MPHACLLHGCLLLLLPAAAACHASCGPVVLVYGTRYVSTRRRIRVGTHGHRRPRPQWWLVATTSRLAQRGASPPRGISRTPQHMRRCWLAAASPPQPHRHCRSRAASATAAAALPRRIGCLDRYCYVAATPSPLRGSCWVGPDGWYSEPPHVRSLLFMCGWGV
jgi:hypothetical protein